MTFIPPLRYRMQARSTTTGRMVSWTVDGAPDWTGAFFPGPGAPEFIAATKYTGDTSPGDSVGTGASSAHLREATHNDSITLTDAAKRSISRARVITGDTVSMTDGVTFHKDHAGARSASDSLIVTDAIKRTRWVERKSNDAPVLTETIKRMQTMSRTVNDQVQVTDFVDSFHANERVIHDSIIVTDALSRMRTSARVNIDTLSNTESMKRTVDMARATTSPSITITDSAKAGSAKARKIADSIGMTDGVTAEKSQKQYRGVNLVGGGAQGSWEGWTGANVSTRNPGQGPQTPQNYTFVTNADVDYLVGKGCKIFRLLFNHEAIQPEAGAAIPYAGALPNASRYAAYYATFKALVDYITSKGCVALIDIHNAEGSFPTGWTAYYLRQFSMTPDGTQENGTTLADLWGRLGTIFVSNPNVWFGIINEPTVSASQWYPVAQAVINAIRASGNTNKIVMPGINTDGARDWLSGGNETAWLALTDSANNMIVQVHTYYDPNNSGTAEIAPNTTYEPDLINGSPAQPYQVGQARLAALTAWARTHGKKVFIGELGISINDKNGADQTALAYQTWQNTRDFINANEDVILGYTWWEYGNVGWAGNIFDLRRQSGVDNPLMTMIENDFISTGGGGPPPAVAPYVASTFTGCSGIWQESYEGSPWTSRDSLGPSNGRTLIEATNPPSVSDVLDGFTSPLFDGTASQLASALAISNFLSAGAFGIGALVKVSSAVAKPASGSRRNANALFSDGASNKFSFGVTSTGAYVSVRDSSSYKDCHSPGSIIDAWAWIFAKLEGGWLKVSVNNANEAAVSCGNIQALTGLLTMGIGASGSHRFAGIVREPMMILTAPDDSHRNAIYADVKARYPSAGLP